MRCMSMRHIKTLCSLLGTMICMAVLASPVRSSVSARQSMSVEHKEKQPFPYVDSGLIAMWDGEWNAGIGQHDPDAASWKDLVSGEDTSLPDVVSVLDNGVYFNDNGSVLWTLTPPLADALKSANITIEMCISIVPYNWVAYRTILVTSGLGNEIYIYTPRGVSTTQSYIFYNYYGRASSVDQILDDTGCFSGTIAIVCEVSSLMGIRYTNGRNTSSATYSQIPSTMPTVMQSSLMTGATIYSVRIYSRHLTADEVAWNSDVDKERFGL